MFGQFNCGQRPISKFMTLPMSPACLSKMGTEKILAALKDKMFEISNTQKSNSHSVIKPSIKTV